MSPFILGTSASSGIAKSIVSGGTLYSDATYNYRVFLASSSFSVTGPPLTADLLVIAGGGGGGNDQNGGGGAGGFFLESGVSLSNGTYSVTIGGGGVPSSGNVSQGTNGSNSQIGSRTAAVGGGVGDNYYFSAGSGGSGGGASSHSPGSGVAGQGYAGSPGPYGGGGGAGGTSGNVNGGIGSSVCSSWGLATNTGQNVSGTVYYAGGGAAGRSSGNGGGGTGGYGGGGNGNTYGGSNATSGTANTGGGGGGALFSAGGNGGSGIAILRYLKTAAN